MSLFLGIHNELRKYPEDKQLISFKDPALIFESGHTERITKFRVLEFFYQSHNNYCIIRNNKGIYVYDIDTKEIRNLLPPQTKGNRFFNFKKFIPLHNGCIFIYNKQLVYLNTYNFKVLTCENFNPFDFNVYHVQLDLFLNRKFLLVIQNEFLNVYRYILDEQKDIFQVQLIHQIKNSPRYFIKSVSSDNIYFFTHKPFNIIFYSNLFSINFFDTLSDNKLFEPDRNILFKDINTNAQEFFIYNNSLFCANHHKIINLQTMRTVFKANQGIIYIQKDPKQINHLVYYRAYDNCKNRKIINRESTRNLF